MKEIDLKNFVRDFILETYEIDSVLSAKEVNEYIYDRHGVIDIDTELKYGFRHLIIEVLEFMFLQGYLDSLNKNQKEKTHPMFNKYRLIKKELI